MKQFIRIIRILSKRLEAARCTNKWMTKKSIANVIDALSSNRISTMFAPLSERINVPVSCLN